MANVASNAALKRWAAIPADKRRLLLDNVWCPDCPAPVTNAVLPVRSNICTVLSVADFTGELNACASIVR